MLIDWFIIRFVRKTGKVTVIVLKILIEGMFSNFVGKEKWRICFPLGGKRKVSNTQKISKLLVLLICTVYKLL